MNVTRVALLLSAVVPVLACPVALCAPATGFPAESDCSDTTREIDSRGAELYVLKISPTPAMRGNDWLWNVQRKGEGNSDAQALLDSGGFWSVGDVWAVPQGSNDAAFAFMTMAGGGLYVDGGDAASVDWGVAPIQQVGNSLPIGRDNGIGLVLPSLPGQYPVTMAPGVIRMFPMATQDSLNYAFAPIAEVNPNDAVPGVCQIGGQVFNPRDPTRGAIIGYNLYRLPPCGCVPTDDDFHRAMLTDDDSDGGWIDFIDLRKFDVTIADGAPSGPGTPPSNDLDPLDAAGIQNPDGRMYSGDEVMLYADAYNLRPAGPGVPPPARGVGYWYRLQPVVYGTVASFAATGFTLNGVYAGDHRMDLDADGEFDAVSLNTVAGAHDTPEFYSPQAEPGNGGLDGLGLTNHGRALLSACFQIDLSVPLAAEGEVKLEGRRENGAVKLMLSTGLETADVAGYDVYRIAGTRRIRVNDVPILAQGGEGNVYELTDRGLASRGEHAAQYVVETLTHSAAAPPAVAGPFTVSLDPRTARRTR